MTTSKDEEMRKVASEALTAEMRKKNNDLKERQRNAADTEAYQQLQNGKNTLLENGEQKEKWKHAMDMADRSIKAEVTAYNDWRNAMLSLLSLYGTLCEAIDQSVKEIVFPVGQIGTAIGRQIYDVISDKIKGDPEIILPTFDYTVKFNDKDELEIDPLDSPNQPIFDGKLDPLFKKGIVLWLDDLGYEPGKKTAVKDDSASFYSKETGAKLTQAEFLKLKDDSNAGLNAFLSDRFDLSFKDNMTPTPKP